MAGLPWRRFALGAVVVVLLLGLVGPAQGSSSFTFEGRGWGHGVGMSQWGARGLADRGWSSDQILRHYYSDTRFQSRSGLGAIRVGLLQATDHVRVTGDGSFVLEGSDGRATARAGETWKVAPNDRGDLVVRRPDGSVAHTSTRPVGILYEDEGTIVRLPQTGHRYKRGKIDVEAHEAGGWKARAVATVGFEEYLYGLGEVPSSWPMEALKAQAVAARSFALSRVEALGQHRPVCNCGVYSTTRDQVYVGYEKEAGSGGSRWVGAVAATAGRIVTYGGKVITAVYSASSGGHTADNEDVWSGSPAPYLRGVCDPGDYAGGANPHNAWKVTLDEAELRARLSNGGVSVGKIRRVEFPSSRDSSGRVGRPNGDRGGVRVVGSKDEVRLSGPRFSGLVGLKSTLLDPPIFGGVRVRYDELGCAPGRARSAEYSWKDLDGKSRARAQDFQLGRLFWHRSGKDVFWVYGGILSRYDTLRADGIDLGLPVSDEEPQAPGGRRSRFERGRIYWSPKTGAHVAYGGILAKYLEVGGPETFGFPTTDEIGVAGGRASYFQKARIYWSSGTGAHIVYGAILNKYLELGGPAGPAGLPVSDEVSISGGRRSDFQRGYITWDRDTGETEWHPTS